MGTADQSFDYCWLFYSGQRCGFRGEHPPGSHPQIESLAFDWFPSMVTFLDFSDGEERSATARAGRQTPERLSAITPNLILHHRLPLCVGRHTPPPAAAAPAALPKTE